MTKIYLDENLSPNIAEGLNILEAPNREAFEVLSIRSVFGRGTPDEEWIPKVGQENAVVITQDINIHKNHCQRSLYRQHNVGVFFVSPPSKSGYQYWEMVEQIIKRWRDIKKHCKSQRPFAFRCTSRSTDFERL